MFKSPQLRANMILSICKYRGKYYIGTFGGGLYVFDSSSVSLSDFEDASLHPVFLNGQIFSMATDADRSSGWLLRTVCFVMREKESYVSTQVVTPSYPKGMCIRSILTPRIEDGYVRKTEWL